jgi:hypothetical protein
MEIVYYMHYPTLLGDFRRKLSLNIITIILFCYIEHWFVDKVQFVQLS